MIEIFKTNVYSSNGAKTIVQSLLEQFPSSVINFDLEDCDKILRVENDTIDSINIIAVLNSLNFSCEILE
jgi:hypothetical protein